MKAAASPSQLTPTPRCDYCGPLGWTIVKWGHETHKCGCPDRTDPWCQAHTKLCDDFTDIRKSRKRDSQLRELPATSFEDIFA